MNLTLLRSFCFLFLVALVSCNRPQCFAERLGRLSVDDLDAASSYTVSEIGWSTRLPSDWNVVSREELEEMGARGKEKIERAGNKVFDEGRQRLVYLKKDDRNMFFSTMEPFSEAKDGPLADCLKETRRVTVDTLQKHGVRLGNVAESVETIDGLEFFTLEIEILDAKTGAVGATQKFYGRLIGPRYFSMVVMSSSEKHRTALTSVVTSSKFTIRS